MNGFGMNNAVTGFISNTEARQEQLKEKKNIEVSKQREENSKAAFNNSINATNEEIKNKYMSMCNNENLAEAIVLAAQSHGSKEYNGLESSAVIDKFLSKNPNKGYEKYVNDCTGGIIGLGEAVKKMKLDRLGTAESNKQAGLSSRVNPLNVDMSSYGTGNESKKTDPTAVAIGVGAPIAIGATDVGLNYLGRGLSRYGNRMLEKDEQFLPTNQVANYQIEYGGTKRLYEDDLRLAKEELKRIESEGGDTTNIKKEIKNIEDSIKNLDKKKSPRTVYDTAKDYGLGKLSNNTVTEKGAAEEAVKIRKKIFRDVLNPIFEKNKTTLNVKKLVDELEDFVEGIVEPGRQSSMFDALEALKEEYQGERFQSLSSDKVQTLKSNLYDEVPEKTWKGKPIASEYKTLKAELAKKIREKELEIIDKAIKNGEAPDTPKAGMFKGKNARDLFFDYENLGEIKDRGAKSLTEPTKMPEIIDKVPIVGELTSPIGDVKTPASRTVANTLVKRGDALKNNTLGQGAKKIFSKFSDALGKIGKATKVEDPAGIIGILQLYFEGMDSLAGKISGKEVEGGYGKELSDILEAMPVMQVENALKEMEDFYMTWDYMTDDARVQTIVDMRKELGKDVSFDDAKYSYEKWKGKKGGGSSQLFWGDGNFPLYKSTDTGYAEDGNAFPRGTYVTETKRV